MKKRTLAWLAVLILINLVDYGLTNFVSEWSEELNPFLSAISEPGRSIFKLAWPTIVGIFFYAAGSKQVFGFHTSSVLKITSLALCAIVTLYTIGGIASFLIGYYW